MTAGDRASVSVYVAVPPADAFAVFTGEIDQWWRTGPKYRMAGRRRGTLAFEHRAGGRLFETFDGHTIEIGKVTVWQPPERLELEWRNANFAPGEVTFVEIRFAPQRDGTLVTVVHRGFAALRPDHPARHGHQGPAMSRMIGLWWGDVLTGLREWISCRSR